MKKLLLMAFIGMSIGSYAQRKKLTEYKAINGITYKVGDTILLGKGSANGGRFAYIQMGAMMSMLSNSGSTRSIDDSMGLSLYANTRQIIKKIERYGDELNSKVAFIIKGNSQIFIDDAISECEVKPCKTN